MKVLYYQTLAFHETPSQLFCTAFLGIKQCARRGGRPLNSREEGWLRREFQQEVPEEWPRLHGRNFLGWLHLLDQWGAQHFFDEVQRGQWRRLKEKVLHHSLTPGGPLLPLHARATVQATDLDVFQAKVLADEPLVYTSNQLRDVFDWAWTWEGERTGLPVPVRKKAKSASPGAVRLRQSEVRASPVLQSLCTQEER